MNTIDYLTYPLLIHLYIYLAVDNR